MTLVRDGKTVDVDVTLATRPADDELADQGSQDQGQQDQQDQGQQGQGGDQGTDPTDPGNVPNPFDWFFGGRG